MNIHEESHNNGCRLRLDGEMTIYTAVSTKTGLMRALERWPAVEIDLSRVCELDTAGAQVLLLAKREAAAEGKRLTLTEHSPAVLDVIQTLNLAGLLGDPLILPADRAPR